MSDSPNTPYNIPLEVFEQILSYLDRSERHRLLPLAVESLATLPLLFDAVVPPAYHTVMLVNTKQTESFFSGIDHVITKQFMEQDIMHKLETSVRRETSWERLRILLAEVKFSVRSKIREQVSQITHQHSLVTDPSGTIALGAPRILPQNLSELPPPSALNTLRCDRRLRCYSCVKRLVMADAPDLAVSRQLYRTALPTYDIRHTALTGGFYDLVDQLNMLPQLELFGLTQCMLLTFDRYLQNSQGLPHPFAQFLGLICQPTTLSITCPMSISPYHNALQKHKLSDRYICEALKPMHDSWRLDRLAVAFYEGGILPTPVGAIVDVLCHVPIKQKRYPYLWPLNEKDGFDIGRLIPVIRGILRTLGYRGLLRTTSDDLKQKRAASKVREWRFTICPISSVCNMAVAIILMARSFEGADVEKATMEELEKAQRTGINVKWSAEKARWVIRFI